MNRTARKTVLWLGAGLSVVVTALALRGMGPELVRYLRIKRM